MAQQAESGGVASEKGRESHGIRISAIDFGAWGQCYALGGLAERRRRRTRLLSCGGEESSQRRVRAPSLDVLLVLQCIQVR